MIRCNLSVLLAERNLKITKVSNDTKISRTTLTSLANNYSQGVQFDTINTLCNYLKITPDQLISYIPVDIEIGNIEIKDISMDINLTIIKNSRTFNCSLNGSCYTDFSDGKLNNIEILIELWDEELNSHDQDIVEENSLIIDTFKILPIPFRNDIKDKIYAKILSSFNEELISDDLTSYFSWPNEIN